MYQDLTTKNGQPGGTRGGLSSRKSLPGELLSRLGAKLLLGLALVAVSGCTGMGHFAHTHVLEHFTPSYLLPYYHCPHCGRVITRLGHHECCGLDPMVPYYGYNATCWRSWPVDWPGCPVTMETVVPTEPGKPLIPEAYDPTPAQPEMPALEPQIRPVVPVDPNEPPSPSDLPPPGSEPPPMAPPPASSPVVPPSATPRVELPTVPSAVVPSPPPAVSPTLPPAPAPNVPSNDPAPLDRSNIPGERPTLEPPASPEPAPLPEETMPSPGSVPSVERKAPAEPPAPASDEDLPNMTDFVPRSAPRPAPETRQPALNKTRSFSAERTLPPAASSLAPTPRVASRPPVSPETSRHQPNASLPAATSERSTPASTGSPASALTTGQPDRGTPGRVTEPRDPLPRPPAVPQNVQRGAAPSMKSVLARPDRSPSAPVAESTVTPDARGPVAEPTASVPPNATPSPQAESLEPSSHQPVIRLAPQYRTPERTLGNPVLPPAPMALQYSEPPQLPAEADPARDERWRFFGGQGPEMRWTAAQAEPGPVATPNPSPGEYSPPRPRPEASANPPLAPAQSAFIPGGSVGPAPGSFGIPQPAAPSGVVRLAPQVPPSQDRLPEQRGVVRLAPASMVR